MTSQKKLQGSICLIICCVMVISLFFLTTIFSKNSEAAGGGSADFILQADKATTFSTTTSISWGLTGPNTASVAWGFKDGDPTLPYDLADFMGYDFLFVKFSEPFVSGLDNVGLYLNTVADVTAETGRRYVFDPGNPSLNMLAPGQTLYKIDLAAFKAILSDIAYIGLAQWTPNGFTKIVSIYLSNDPDGLIGGGYDHTGIYSTGFNTPQPTPQPTPTPPPPLIANIYDINYIMVDQIGYRPGDDKVAVIANPQIGFNAGEGLVPKDTYTYQVRDAATDAVVYEGHPDEWNAGMVDPHSGDKAWWFDFSPVGAPGRYYIYDVDNDYKSYEFNITENVYEKELYHALRMLYYQREGIEHKPPFAEVPWNDDAAWMGDLVARDYFNPTNLDRIRNVSHGWMDAGDTTKYITFVEDIVHDMFTAYELNPDFYDDFNLNIPESYLDAPDILSEVKWELDWVIHLQDYDYYDDNVYKEGSNKVFGHGKGPWDNDGSVFVKSGRISTNTTSMNNLVGANVGPQIGAGQFPPSQNPSWSFYNGKKSTASTVDAASFFAHGALNYKKFPAYAEFAAELEERAEVAWDYYYNALVNGKRTTTIDNAEIVNSGADRNLWQQDNMALCASIYLYALTGKDKYHDYIKANYMSLPPMDPSKDDGERAYWQMCAFMTELKQVSFALLYYMNLPDADTQIAAAIKDAYIARATDPEVDTPYEFYPNYSAYRSYMADELYLWGSNQGRGTRGHDAATLAELNFIPEKSAEYRKRALGQLHYFNGVNPFNMTYLTSMQSAGATKSATYMYHEWFMRNDGQPRVWDGDPAAPESPPGYVPGGANKFWRMLDFANASAVPSYHNIPHMKSYVDLPHNYRVGSYTYNDSYAFTEPMCHYQGAFIVLATYFVGQYTSGSVPAAPLNELDGAKTFIGIPFLKGTPYQLPGIVRAEGFDAEGRGLSWGSPANPSRNNAFHRGFYQSIGIEDCSEGGYNVYDTRAGDWMNYTVEVAETGYYDIAARVSASVNGASFHVSVNGAPVSGATGVPNTGRQNWQDVVFENVLLEAGQQKLQLFFDTAGASVSRLLVSPATIDIVGFEPISIITPVGIAPKMPNAVTAVLQDNSSVQLPIVWDTIEPSKYADEGSFAASGTAYNEVVNANIAAVKMNVTGVEPINVRAMIGHMPVLPEQVTINYEDWPSQQFDVKWEAIPARMYSVAGEFAVSGAIDFNSGIVAVANVKIVPYLLGAPIGTGSGADPVNLRGVKWAFDDDLSTDYVSQAGNNRWVGLDLGAGNEQAISMVRVYISEGFQHAETALAGAAIHGLNTNPGNNTNNSTVIGNLPSALTTGWNTVIITDPTPFRYVRLFKPNTAYAMYIAELEFYPAANLALVSVAGPASVASGAGAVASYTVSARSMPPISGVELEFEVDGDYLSSKTFTPMGGFSFFGDGNYGTPIYWKNDGNIWTGKVTLIDTNAAGTDGEFDILNMVFDVKEGALGEAAVRLNYVKMSFASGQVNIIIVDGEALTVFEQYFSPYDMNKDGVVDINDLTFALQYLLAKEGDPNWEAAKAADFDDSGEIGIEDLIMILANYTIPYYN